QRVELSGHPSQPPYREGSRLLKPESPDFFVAHDLAAFNLRTRLVELACLDLGERLVVVRSRPARSNAAREPHEIPGEQGRRAAALCGRGGLDAGWDKCAIARLCSSAPACY